MPTIRKLIVELQTATALTWMGGTIVMNNLLGTPHWIAGAFWLFVGLCLMGIEEDK